MVGPFRGDAPDKEGSLHFWAFNTAKEGVTLDIASVKGAEMLRKLVEKADVLLESYDPGYMDSLGLGYPELKRYQPGAGDDVTDRVWTGWAIPRLQDIGPGGDGNGRDHA